MLKQVIGITGPAGCGKDTAADYIIGQCGVYRKASFADPLKQMLHAIGLTQAQTHGDLKDIVDPRYGVTPRHMMQKLGTEWGRQCIHPNIWVRAMFVMLEDEEDAYIIPDVRFENEANFVRQHGTLIHIVGRDRVIDATHVSESGVVQLEQDVVIHNTGSLQDLYRKLQRAVGGT